MATSAKIIADSISTRGVRLVTMEVTFHRYILAELNTHRDFSRNSASSRARSVKKTIQEVEADPAYPPVFPSERKGMSGGEPLDEAMATSAGNLWWNAAVNAVDTATKLAALGVHKSVVNRVLEPFMWHTAVLTATEWDNFFDQRLALLEDGTPAADPAMYALAVEMKAAMDDSESTPLTPGEWHLPYITGDDVEKTDDIEKIKKISIARCAGVSYLTQGVQGRDHSKDLALYERLRHADPTHWSPFEHVATPATFHMYEQTPRFFNLRGWQSMRWAEEVKEIPFNV